MWRGALRRFALLLAVTSSAAALLGLAVGALSRYGVERGVAVSFYVAGVVLVVAGFVATSRGPVRSRDGKSAGYGAQTVRWATRSEQEETMNLSAVLVVLGLALIAIGVVVDGRHTLA